MSEAFRCDYDQDISLPGYHGIITGFREPTDDNKGGVAVFIKESIDYKIRNDVLVFIPHVLSLFVESASNIGKSTIVGVICRPNTFPRADVDIFKTTLFGVMGQINNNLLFRILGIT